VFHEKLPELFKLVKKETSYCLLPTCPQPIRTKEIGLVQVNVSVRGQVTQESIDLALLRSGTGKADDHTFTREPCDLEMDVSVTSQLDESLWRQLWRGNEDPDIQEPWICCRGTREFVSVEIISCPNILIIENPNGCNDQNSPLPAPFFRISGQEYHLGVLIYKSAVHFRSIIILQDKYLFYDGLKTPKLCYIRPHQIQKKMDKFFITEMWYVKQSAPPPRSPPQEHYNVHTDSSSPILRFPSPLPTPSPPPPLSPVLHPPAPISPISPPSPRRSLSPDREPALKSSPKRPRRTHYPFGFSLHPVATSGVIPSCRGCHSRIGRGGDRLVWKTMDNEAMKYTKIYHFHVDDTCLKSGLESFPRELEAARETMRNKK